MKPNSPVLPHAQHISYLEHSSLVWPGLCFQHAPHTFCVSSRIFIKPTLSSRVICGKVLAVVINDSHPSCRSDRTTRLSLTFFVGTDTPDCVSSCLSASTVHFTSCVTST